jgi:hypothetical protein
MQSLQHDVRYVIYYGGNIGALSRFAEVAVSQVLDQQMSCV